MKSFQSDPKPCKLMWFKPTGEHQPLHHVVNSMETFLVMAFFAVSITLKISLVSKVSNSCISFSENIKP